MQTTMICYADDHMRISQRLCTESATEVGKIDRCIAFGPYAIDKFFYDRHKQILESPQRGGGKGFWLWKPYIVDQAIRSLPDGDILIYCDSGVEWIDHVYNILHAQHESENDIFLFSNGHRHIDWCKKEVWASMLLDESHNDYASIDLQNAKQVQASVMIFRVNAYTRDFCARWLAWSCVPGFIDDTTIRTQLPEFREHRNDQSILTNLAIEDGIKLHWWPAQYWQNSKANYPGDNYPQMFYHHRMRDSEWVNYAMHNGLGYNMDIAINHFMKQPKNV